MATWRPQTELEEEIVALQPDHNFIFGHLTDKVFEEERFKNICGPEFGGHSISIMRAVAEMTGTKKEMVKLSDWDDDSTVQREITGMLRYFGMGSSNDEPLNATAPKSERKGSNSSGSSKQKSSLVLLNENDFKIVSTRMKKKAEKEAILNDPLKCSLLKMEKEYANSYSNTHKAHDPVSAKNAEKSNASAKMTTVQSDFGNLKLYTPAELYRMKRGNRKSSTLLNDI